MAHPSYGTRHGLKRASHGVRAVAPTFGKPAFLVGAPKLGGAMLLESAAERVVTQLLHLDPDVKTVTPQPLTLDLIDGVVLYSPEAKQAARARHKALARTTCFYTPDLLARPSMGVDTIIEVKSDAYRGDDAYENKLQMAKDILWRHGMQFVQVVVPSYWRHPLLSNVPLLHHASLRRDLVPEPGVFEQMQRLAEQGVGTLGAYCDGLGMGMRMAPVLVSCGALSVDILAHHLCTNTPATLAYGALDHLSAWRRLVE